jgi:hypothetical protein
MNANQKLGQSASRGLPASLLPCIPASLDPCVPASALLRPRTRFQVSLLTNHHPRITSFLIDISAIRIRPISFAFNTNVICNRHSKRPFPFCTIGAKLAKVLYSLRDLVCYSRRRTRVPPLGLRALAPARPTGCESLPLPGHGELCVSAGSQFRLETSKLNGDFRAPSYAN